MIEKCALAEYGNSSQGSALYPSRHFDVVVVGGGIVGTVQALLLAQQGRSVLLIEAAAPESATAPLQQRSVALSYRSFELLSAKGLWPGNDVCPIREIHVTDRGSFGSASITARDLNTAALGYVIANHSFERHLHQLVQSQEHIELLQPATATLLHCSGTSAELRVSSAGSEQGTPELLQKELLQKKLLKSEPPPSESPQPESMQREVVKDDAAGANDKEFTVRCNLLIAADGTHSKIRSSLGLKQTQRNYDQVAVVANVACQDDHQHIAHERFTDSGPLALLPLSRRCMAMVFTARECDSVALKSMPDTEFLQLLQLRFGGKLGRFNAVGRRAVFPLALSESESQTSGCCVLIGNAARTLHPVAGQGLNLALRDVFALASSVGRCSGSGHESGLAAGLDPRVDNTEDLSLPPLTKEWPNGDLSQALADFEQQRWRDQRATVRRTDLLARIFSIGSAPLGPLRGASLAMLNGLGPLRRRFAADSAGLGVSISRSRKRQS